MGKQAGQAVRTDQPVGNKLKKGLLKDLKGSGQTGRQGREVFVF